MFKLYSSYCPFWVHVSSLMEVSASVTISFPLSHEKRKKILCDGRCDVPSRYPHLQERRTFSCGNWNCYGQTAVICWNLSGVPQLNNILYSRPRHLSEAMAFKDWSIQEYKVLAGLFGTAMSDYVIFRSPSRFAKVPTYAARLLLLLNQPCILLFPSIVAVPKHPP